MDKKSLEVIKNEIWSVQRTIALLACDNWPYTPFCDDDIDNMYYSLNDMFLKITDKIKALEES